MKNFDNLFDNIDLGMNSNSNADFVKREVSNYIAQSEGYLNKAKDGMRMRDTTEDEGEESPFDNGQLLKCVRKDGRRKKLDYIPVDERGKEEWIKSRKVDANLEMDFLPRNLVYNGNSYLDSAFNIEKALYNLGERRTIMEVEDEYEDKRRKKGGFWDTFASKIFPFFGCAPGKNDRK